MSNLLENIGKFLLGTGSGAEHVDGLLDWFGNVATALIGNEIFQIVLAVVVFTLLFGVLVGLAKGIKSRKKR